MYEDVDTDYFRPEWTEDEYPAWNSESSRVISGPLGDAKFPGTKFATWQEAKAYAESRYKVLKFGCLPGRWLARIKR